MVIAYLAAVAMTVMYGVSAVLEDIAAKRIPTEGRGGRKSAVRVTVSPVYLAGISLSAVAWVASLVALHWLPLFVVQAMTAGSIGLVVLITWARTGRTPSRLEAALLVGLGVGLVVLAVSASGGESLSVGPLFRSLVWLGVPAVVWAGFAASRITGNRGSALLGLVSGLSDSGLALCARAIDVDTSRPFTALTEPLVLALAPFSIIGVVCFAAALQRGTASAALACQQAAITVVPSAIGLAVLGDRARSGLMPLMVGGFALTIAALLALTLSGDDGEAARPA